MNTKTKPYRVVDLPAGRRLMINMHDHDGIDGAPAARFTQRLIELIEGGYGLCEAEGR